MIDRSETKNAMIGYARVSTSEQNLSLQINALRQAGCQEIFSDKISGAKAKRPGLANCLSVLNSGDQLIVWRLDRLGRSLLHLVSVVSDLRKRNIGFRSLMDGSIDTTTASGELIFNIFASLAQFERQLIRERTRAGLAVARARGKNGGRPRLEPNDPRVIMAKKMYLDKSVPIGQVCATLKISRATFYRYVAMKA